MDINWKSILFGLIILIPMGSCMYCALNRQIDQECFIVKRVKCEGYGGGILSSGGIQCRVETEDGEFKTVYRTVIEGEVICWQKTYHRKDY